MRLNTDTSGIAARLALWSALAFALNLTWEVAHVQLYSIWVEADGYQLVWSLIHCTLGDVLIALVAFAVTGAVLWRSDWPTSRPLAGGFLVVLGTLGYTAWSEWFNVYRLGSWGYSESMPLLFGIGLSPLLQWLILPPIMIAIYRNIAPSLPRRSTRGAR